MNNITKEQAVNVLIQAVEVAQRKGAYGLEDAKNIILAIEALVPTKEAVEEKE